MEKYVFNETVYLGYGCRSVLPQELIARGFKKVLVIADHTIAKVGLLDKVTSLLKNIEYETFLNVQPNPTVANVQEGLQVLEKCKADCLVAVGGGSVIDTAKAIAIIARNPEFRDVVSLNGTASTKNKCMPLIALPTTAGTAAEVTINYVITDTEHKKKMVCVDAHDIPILSLVDAELMSTMPAGTTASTGLDALTHAIESLITKNATQFSDMFALESIKTIAKYLHKAYIEPNNIEAREKMAFAQYVVGMGFSNVGLGIVHSMAHPLGGQFDVPHGVANAMLLPTVMRYNINSPSKPKFRLIAEAFGVNTQGLNDDEAADLAVELVENLRSKLNIPQSLSEFGITEKDLDSLSVDAYNDICTGGNPRDTSVADIKKLYAEIL